MKIFYLESEPYFYCVPREYPKVSDSITLVLRDEQTNDIYNIQTTFMIAEKLRISATELPDGFVSQQRFDLSLYIDAKIIYKGKLIVLDKDTDIQNFTYGKQSTAKYNFRE